MDLGGVIQSARKRAGLSQDALGSRIGVSGVAVGQWESGKTTPTGMNMLRLMDVLDISADDIADADYFFGSLEAAAQRYASNLIAPVTDDVTAPLYGSIAAGKPIEEQPVESHLWVPPDLMKKHPNAFYLKVEGESMNRVLPNGCYALIDPTIEPTSGDIAALNVNGHAATIKRVLRGRTSVILSPESVDEGFEDQVFDFTQPGTDEVTLIGKVIWHLPPYDAIIKW